MRKIIALLLAAAMAFSLVIVAGATEETTKQTAQLNVECTGVTADGVATFTISIVAPASGVAALQFTLTPEGMTYKEKTLTDLASVFKPGIAGVQNGDFDFTVKGGVGKYIAYGGSFKDNRYLSGTTTLLTIQYQLDADAESGTLNIGDFKACQSGSQAIDQTTAYTCTAPESVEATRPTTPPPTPPTPSTLKGDVTGDGEVDIGDHQYLFEHLQGINVITDAAQLAVADVNGDESVDIGDHQRLFEHLQGIKLLS